MNLFDFLFTKDKKPANQARDRLKIMLAHERADCALPYIDDLRRDLIEVIKKYTQVDEIKIKSEKNQNIDLIEVEIVLGK